MLEKHKQSTDEATWLLQRQAACFNASLVFDLYCKVAVEFVLHTIIVGGASSAVRFHHVEYF